MIRRMLNFAVMITITLSWLGCDSGREPVATEDGPSDGPILGSTGSAWGSAMYGTPVAENNAVFKNIQSFIVGDSIYVCDTNLQWHREMVKYSAGVGPSTRGNTMIKVDIQTGGSDMYLLVTMDMLFRLSNGKFQRADRLVPGRDILTQADGSPAPILSLEIGKFTGGLQSISTDRVGRPGGHLLNLNGIICADVAFALSYDLEDDLPFIE